MYVREQKGVDPLLQLDGFKSVTIEVRPMNSMSRMGRVRYIRYIIAIGNGKGAYGFGVGFGKKAFD